MPFQLAVGVLDLAALLCPLLLFPSLIVIKTHNSALTVKVSFLTMVLSSLHF